MLFLARPCFFRHVEQIQPHQKKMLIMIHLKEEPAKTYKIGVTQIVEHPSLNAAYDGFKKALADAGIEVEYDVQIAQGDPSLIRRLQRTL